VSYSVLQCVAVYCSVVQYVAMRCMMMIAFITFNSSLGPLIEGLCSSNPWEFEFTGFRRNETDDLGINSPRSDQLSHACT